MGRLKLKGEKKPSVWDQRKRSSIENKPVDIERARNEAPNGIPEGCTWIGILGVAGDATCKATGDAFEAGVARLGKPFVLWEKTGVEYDPGDIPVVVLYATDDDALRQLGEAFGKKDRDGKYVFPMQVIRSLKSGEGIGSCGTVTDADVERVFSMAKGIRDRADPPATA